MRKPADSGHLEGNGRPSWWGPSGMAPACCLLSVDSGKIGLGKRHMGNVDLAACSCYYRRQLVRIIWRILDQCGSSGQDERDAQESAA